MLFRCQPGFETFLEKEIVQRGFVLQERGEGWVRASGAEKASVEDLCFAHQVLVGVVEVTGDSVNALAGRLVELFLESARTERFEQAWPLVFDEAAGLEGLGRRVKAVEEEFFEQLKKRMSRVAKLATPDLPRGVVRCRGLAVFFVDFKRALVAREILCNGPRRMADDPLAPSRSYLKVEEAYAILGREPEPGDTVADLGAAPGGWSYSAAKRGAEVVAVDNGPLKGGALGHSLIKHLKEDAFRFQPPQGQRYGWLFCDLVEEPHHVLKNLIEPWILHGWCVRFVVILKFGRVDPLALLKEVLGPGSVLREHTTGVRVRHLYHDREEFTLVGEVKR